MCPAPHRKPYPSDVRDEEWLLVVSYLTLMTEAAPQREHSPTRVVQRSALRDPLRHRLARYAGSQRCAAPRPQATANPPIGRQRRGMLHPARDRIGLLAVGHGAPLVERVGRNDAAPHRQCAAEQASARRRLGADVDRLAGCPQVLGEVRHQRSGAYDKPRHLQPGWITPRADYREWSGKSADVVSSDPGVTKAIPAPMPRPPDIVDA